MPIDLSRHSDAELALLYRQFQRGLQAYLRAHKPFWTQTLGLNNASVSNCEQGLTHMLTLGKTPMPAGCVALAAHTLRLLEAVPRKRWKLQPWRVGLPLFGHSAVALCLEGERDQPRYIFDAWINLTPLAYTSGEWAKKMGTMALARRPHSDGKV